MTIRAKLRVIVPVLQLIIIILAFSLDPLLSERYVTRSDLRVAYIVTPEHLVLKLNFPLTTLAAVEFRFSQRTLRGFSLRARRLKAFAAAGVKNNSESKLSHRPISLANLGLWWGRFQCNPKPRAGSPPYSSFAVIVIFAFSTFDTGHPVSAASAYF